MVPLAFVALFVVLWGIFWLTMPAIRHGGRLLARLVARNVRVERFVTSAHERIRNYLPILLVLVAGGVLTAMAGDGFVDMAERLHQKGGKLQFVDTYVHDSAVQHRTATATRFFVVMSIVGGPSGVASILAAVALALFLTRRYRWLIYLVVTAGGGALMNLELKHHFARVRPDVAEMIRRAHGYSFPSGHAMGSTVVFGALTYLAVRTFRSWKWQSAAISFSVTFVAAVAASRVYLGVHWISDVGAGITAGTVWTVSTTVAYETLRRVRLLRALRAHTPRNLPRSSGREGMRSP